MRQIDTGKLLEIGIALSRERDQDRLLHTILESAMELTGCDGGTLYRLEDGALAFKHMVTLSMGVCRGGDGAPIDLPPVALSPENVCARAALEGTLINVSDVYHDTRFDFTGPRRYDAITGYRTVSMLVAPMENDRGEVIGVLQLINARENGAVTAFDPALEPVVLSLASQAAILLTNIGYAREAEELLRSFVGVMSTAIDARSRYNANHTRNMARYAERFFDYLSSSGQDWQPDEAARREFLMSVWLHDVGKLVIPLEVMDKDSRLGPALPEVEARFRIIGLLAELRRARGELDEAAYAAETAALEEARALVAQVNTAGFLPDGLLARVDELAARTYLDETGTPCPWLTGAERTALSVRKGTLTAHERQVMESHVAMTARLLGRMRFSHGYRNVPQWAAAHHELLDGSGYPDHLKGGQIPREVRLLTILDVFDALTAKDRPYKAPIPIEKALAILDGMAEGGQLDGTLLSLFKASACWEDPADGPSSEGGNGS